MSTSSVSNEKWTLQSRPEGFFSASKNSTKVTEEIDLSSLAEEEIIVKVETLSVDAFLRTMLDEEAYHGSISLGNTLPALGQSAQLICLT